MRREVRRGEKVKGEERRREGGGEVRREERRGEKVKGEQRRRGGRRSEEGREGKRSQGEEVRNVQEMEKEKSSRPPVVYRRLCGAAEMTKLILLRSQQRLYSC